MLRSPTSSGRSASCSIRVRSLSELSNVTVAQIAPVIPYLLLVLILILRPTGLFGTRET